MKAIAMFSGGLDSILTVKLLEDQGIDVIAVNYTSSFFSSKNAEKSAKANNINLKVFDVSKEYLKIVRHPKYGYGSAINPCVDCKSLLIKLAWAYAKKIGAKFIATGEILGQRPMSQHMGALNTIKRESGVEGYLLRPLCAKNLFETIPEKKGWVDREKLMAFSGRGRKNQMELAKKYDVNIFPSPAGGCLLCEIVFERKMRDLFKRKEKITLDDIEFLKFGRLFAVGDARIIIGRDEKENAAIEKLVKPSDKVFEVIGVGSPITILRYDKSEKAIRTAAELTARYSSAPKGEVDVTCGKKIIKVKKPLKYDEKKFLI